METFEGNLYVAGEDGFEEAAMARIFNHRRPSRRPAAVLEALSERDVAAGVRLAAAKGWKVSVRSGGHSWAAWSVREGSLLIDLGGLHEMSYDPSSHVVKVSPSTNGEQLAHFLTPHGRLFCGGHCPTVGLGGFLLQGGQGWNARGWGWGVEYVSAIDVVMPDGELVHASESENSELLWAARGAGPGFFGVVTRFHLRTVALPAAIRQSTYAYPMSHYDEVMSWFANVQRELPETVEAVALAATIPELSDEHILIVHGLALEESEEGARVALVPLESYARVDEALLRVVNATTSLAQEYLDQYRANPVEHRYRVDNSWIDQPADVSVPALRRAFTQLPTSKSFSLWFSMDPLRELPDMAFSLQAPVYFACYLVSEDPGDDERVSTWLEATMAEIEPIAQGCYLGDSDFTRRAARFMSDTSWRRLEQLRQRYDPDGLFVGYLGEVAQ